MGCRVRAKCQFVPCLPTEPAIAEMGDCGIISQVITPKLVWVIWENGNSCQCGLDGLEILG